MYAIVEQGGKQFKVSKGDSIEIDLTQVQEDAKVIEIEKVLFFSDGENVKIGKPYIEGAKVTALLAQGNAEDSLVKGPKLYPMTFRRRKNSAKRIGHRQKYLQVIIDSIQA